jgi:thiamine-monophosphate kinase
MVLLGPGDDAAVVAAPDGHVVATTDLMVEGRHFRRDWSTGYDVGRKAAAANLSDVVAMGARPTALLVGLACPADLPVGWVEALADGLRDEAALVGASVVGGDLVGGDAVTVAVTALGDLGGRPPVLRSGARPGDAVVLLGSPGRAAAGLALLEAGRSDDPLADAHRRPQPEYDAALALVDIGAVTAMIDVSDGLLSDLDHVAVASGVAIDLRAADLPVDDAVLAAADLLGVDVIDWIASGGDDHCFAAVVAADRLAGLLSVLAEHVRPQPVRIGVVVAADADRPQPVSFVDRVTPTRRGHAHFG